MMKPQKLPRFIIILSSLLVLSYGCNDTESNPCGGGAPSKFDITDIQLKAYIQSSFPDYPSIVYSYPEYSEGAAIDFDSLVYSLESVIQNIASRTPERSPFYFPLIKRAYACTPLGPTTDQMVTDIIITSATGFNDSHSSGSSLNAFFGVIYAESSTSYYTYTNSHVSYFNVDEYMAQGDVQAGEIIQLRLNTRPQYLENQKFYISISLDDGEAFYLETPLLHFN